MKTQVGGLIFIRNQELPIIDNVGIYEADVKDIDINDCVRFEVNATKETKIIELEGKYTWCRWYSF